MTSTESSKGIGEAAAAESVSTRFTRLMKATTSPLGMLTDPPIVAIATAVGLVAMLAALRMGAPPPLTTGLAGLAALPLLAGITVFLVLGGARRALVAWLGALPFPVDNMNAVLNGLGEQIEVVFEGAPPATPEVNRRLDEVNPEAFVTESNEELRALDIRIGVVDSKRNPARTNHQRFARVRDLVDRVLVPLHAERRIVGVRIK